MTNEKSLSDVCEKFRTACDELNSYKSRVFPYGTTVKVDYDSYRGYGMSMGECAECQADKIAVRLDNGNVWYYPIDRCQVVHVKDLPPSHRHDIVRARGMTVLATPRRKLP